MSHRITYKEAIERFRKAHGNLYDYSLITEEWWDKNYKSAQKTKVPIICREHGVFYQPPFAHWNGHHCFKCKGKPKQSLNEIKNRLQKIHNNKYDYSLITEEWWNKNYNPKYNSFKIPIVCEEHGVFYQQFGDHLNGHGCPDCNKWRKKSREEHLEDLRKIHNNIYVYSLITEEWFQENYKNTRTKIPIICKKHGVFYLELNRHKTLKTGCSKCNSSRGELAIREYLELKFSSRTILEQKELKISSRTLKFDFFIPKLNLAIEYDGIQHFQNIDVFGNNLKDTKIRDFLKNKYCFINNINLIRIPYWEFEKKSKEEFFKYLDKIFKREGLKNAIQEK